MAEDKAIYVGLCLAGAVSGGSYSAGVVDYIIEALDNWQQAKGDTNKKDEHPDHQVVIAGLTGASAGSIVNALLPLDLAILDQAAANSSDRDDKQDEHRLKLLYEAWVESPHLYHPEDGFLGDRDLRADNDYYPLFSKANEPLPSIKRLWALLDSSLLDRIVKRTFDEAETTLKDQQYQPSQREYIAESLHSFMTLTNNVGVRYDVAFNSGTKSRHIMVRHADRTHFRIKGIGTDKFFSPWANADPALDCDLDDLDLFSKAEIDAYKNSALASSAFPLGLGARKINHLTRGDYYARQWTLPSLIEPPLIKAKTPLEFRRRPFFPEESDSDQIDDDIEKLSSDKLKAKYTQPVPFVASDGGVINNEPFDITRHILMAKPPVRNPRDGDGTRVVLMVDPFPLLKTNAGLAADNSMATLLATLPLNLLNESRFKSSELEDLIDEEVYSRFLITPEQDVTGIKDVKTDAPRVIDDSQSLLASGLLHGFGGFISESFRAYDYQLGRLHAWHFLRDSFGLPKTKSKLLNSIYKRCKNSTEYHCGDNKHWQIIPVPAKCPVQKLEWPRISLRDYSDLMKHIEKRKSAIMKETTSDLPFLKALSKLNIGKAFTNVLAELGISLVVGKAVKSLAKTILADLVRRDQLQEACALSVDQRKLMVKIIEAGEDGLPAKELLEKKSPQSKLLKGMLDKFSALVVKKFKASSLRIIIVAKPLL